MKHLAVIRFWYEGNSFSPVPADAEMFRAREWVSGPAAREFYHDINVEIAAVEGFVEADPEIEAHYIFCAAAYPAGPMVPGLFNSMLGQIEEELATRDWDGVYLSLHGSSVTADAEHPELSLLESVRNTVGSIPLAVTLDLHANIEPALGRLANIVVGYKTYPHIDMLETGERALALLGRSMNGEINPVSLILPVEFAPTSFNMQTASGPMADMIAAARGSETEHGFYDLSVFGGFVYADSPQTGAAISLCAEKGHPDATSEATRLSRAFLAQAGNFDVYLPQPAPVLKALSGELASNPDLAPVAVLEPSDNVFSGGGADTPELLRQALEIGVGAPALFAFFWDPEISARAHQVGLGAVFDCAFGGRLTDCFGQPVRTSAKVERLTKGQFINLGPMENGLAVDLGATAVMRVGELRIIVTSRNIPVNDRAYFQLHDLDPADFAVTYVKAKNHFRAAFADVFKRMIEVETPGPASSNLAAFQFRNVPDSKLFLQTPVRDAEPEDTDAIAALHATSWRKFYKGILPESYLAAEIETERYQFWYRKLADLPGDELVLTARSGGALTGFIWVTRTGEPGYDAVIQALHVNPGRRGSGIGKRLLAGAVRRLLAVGARSVCLRVFDANKQAIGFYTRLGGIADEKGIDDFVGANAPDTRIGWTDLNSLLSICGND
ncbi:MAG: GNAT family N-acetyltransferase [Gammaproteobacteria bacterium]|nr:GNAT family N-acetyltransferase [Gammaproteobacteria bacterium]